MRLKHVVGPIWNSEMGKRLAHCRMHLDLSQQELGAYLGIPQNTISRLEAGQGSTTQITLAKLESVFQNPRVMEYLLYGVKTFDVFRSVDDYYRKRLGRRKRGEIIQSIKGQES